MVESRHADGTDERPVFTVVEAVSVRVCVFACG